MPTGWLSLSELREQVVAAPLLGYEYVLMVLVAAFFILVFFWQSFMQQRHIKRVLEDKSVAEAEAAAAAALTPAE